MASYPCDLLPHGIINITENGTYDVTDKSEANVAIPLPIGDINITENGTYDVTDKVTANVDVPPPDRDFTLKLNVYAEVYYPGGDNHQYSINHAIRTITRRNGVISVETSQVAASYPQQDVGRTGYGYAWITLESFTWD